MGDEVTITPGGVPPGRRRAIFASTRLLHEWASLQPWESPPIYELRLGPTPLVANGYPLTPQVEAMVRRFNRYADMIGITATELQVIEAKMFPDPGAISQVLLYRNLVYSTPLLQQYPNHLVQAVILSALGDPVMAQMATAQGVRWITYTPAWASDYVQRRYTAKKLLPESEA